MKKKNDYLDEKFVQEQQLVRIYNQLVDVAEWCDLNSCWDIRHWIDLALPFVDMAGELFQQQRFAEYSKESEDN